MEIEKMEGENQPVQVASELNDRLGVGTMFDLCQYCGHEKPKGEGCGCIQEVRAERDRYRAALEQIETMDAENIPDKWDWWKGRAEIAHEAKLALDEALESVQSLEARLEVEARTTWSLLSYLSDLRFALGDDGRRMQDELLEYCRDLRRSKDAVQAALGNGADEAAWEPGEHWADAAARMIGEVLERGVEPQPAATNTSEAAKMRATA